MSKSPLSLFRTFAFCCFESTNQEEKEKKTRAAFSLISIVYDIQRALKSVASWYMGETRYMAERQTNGVGRKPRVFMPGLECVSRDRHPSSQIIRIVISRSQFPLSIPRQSPAYSFGGCAY